MALEGGGGSGGAKGVRMGGAYVELGVKDSMSAALKRVGQKFAQFGQMVLKLTGVGGVVGGLLGGMSFKSTADDMAKMLDVAKAFGISGKQASGLFGVLAAAGGEFKENLEGVIQFSDTLNEALKGGDTQGAKLFDGLAVTAKEMEGLEVDEQFYRVHEAIRQLPQPLQEAKLALLGGTDSMKQWQRLLSMSSEEVRQMAADLAISTKELEDAQAASRGMEQAGAALGRVWQQTVIMLAPVVTQVANAVVGALKPVIEWMRGRTLQDLWDEFAAWAKFAWEQVKQWGRQAWSAVSGWAEDAWYDMEAAAKLAWISLMEWLDKILSKEFWKGLLDGFIVQINAIVNLFTTAIKNMVDKAVDFFKALGQALLNPLKALELLGGIPLDVVPLNPEDVRKAVEDAQKEAEKAAEKAAEVEAGGRKAALDEAERKKLAAAMRRAAELAEGQKGVDDALAEVRRVQAEIEARRKKRMEEEPAALKKKRDEAMNRLGFAMVAAGPGAFFRQAYGVQSASDDVGKKLDKGNKLAEKQVGLLAAIDKKVGPAVATA